MSGRSFLLIGGCLSLIAAAMHITIIIGGPTWYRFFGAGDTMARMAERGEIYPTLVTLGIAAVLAVWSAYAFSGAGLLPRFPLLRTGLMVISTIFLLRAVTFVPVLVFSNQPVTAFAIWSSLIVLLYGLTYVIGTWLAWPSLAPVRVGVAS